MRSPGAGRPAKPAAVKIAEGMRGHHPVSEREAALVATTPKCPAFLRGPGRFMWKRLVLIMRDRGTIQIEDQGLLASYCQSWQTLNLATRAWGQLPEEEMWDGKGVRLQKTIREAQDRLVKCAAWLGFSPVARARLLSDELQTAVTNLPTLEEIMSGDSSDPRFAEPVN